MANICHNKRNADKDTVHYFDKKLYKERYSVDSTNAWMDSFHSLLNRFETKITKLERIHFSCFL